MRKIIENYHQSSHAIVLTPSHPNYKFRKCICNILVTTVGLGLYIKQVSFHSLVVPFFLAPLLPSNPPFSRALFLSLSVLLYLMLFINVPTSHLSFTSTKAIYNFINNVKSVNYKSYSVIN